MRARTLALAALTLLVFTEMAGISSAQTPTTTEIHINVSETVVWNDDLTIHVNYPNGSVTRNATVTFNGTKHFTDSKGEVVVTPEGVGSFTVTASKNGFTAREEVAVLPELHLELSRGVVPLTVKTPIRATVTYAHNGSPVEGVTVNASGARAVTGEDGSAVVLVTSNRDFGVLEVNAERTGTAGTEAMLNTSGAYVFGLSTEGKLDWTVVFLLAFVVVGLVVLNQLVNDTLVLKE